MKKMIISLLSCMFLVIILTGCGEKTGYEELLTDLDASSTETSKSNWTLESTNYSDLDENMKNLVNGADYFECKLYIGYKVNTDSIDYAFAGYKDDKKMLLVVRQDTDNKLEYNFSDYDNASEIYLEDIDEE